MTRFQRYLLTKTGWFLVAFAVALTLNFLLIRLIPGNPVDTMVQNMSAGGAVTGEAMAKIYKAYMAEFGLDEPIWPTFLGASAPLYRLIVLLLGIALVGFATFFSFRRVGNTVLRVLMGAFGALLLIWSLAMEVQGPGHTSATGFVGGQFFQYVGNLAHGDLGVSFRQSPARVGTLIMQALPWTIGLQLPAILIGWILGNMLGVRSAYKRGWMDKGLFPISLFMSGMPYYCLSILLLYLFAVVFRVLPASGGYDFSMRPNPSWNFVGSVAQHYILPFLSLVIIFLGGQAVGMRSMAIYELDADYVRYSRSLGVDDNRVERYIFRNAMLPQITGLALSIAGMVSGALITEIVFSYPGIGFLLFGAIRQEDYPVVQGVTLMIMIAVLATSFAVEIAYGFIDPRIRATQTGER